MVHVAFARKEETKEKRSKNTIKVTIITSVRSMIFILLKKTIRQKDNIDLERIVMDISDRDDEEEEKIMLIMNTIMVIKLFFSHDSFLLSLTNPLCIITRIYFL